MNEPIIPLANFMQMIMSTGYDLKNNWSNAYFLTFGEPKVKEFVWNRIMMEAFFPRSNPDHCNEVSTESLPRGEMGNTISPIREVQSSAPPMVSEPVAKQALKPNTGKINSAKSRFEPLCFGKAIAKGESNLVYGYGGSGKTPFSYLPGMNEEIKYPVYINVDQDSDKLDPIYEKALGGKGELISITSFDNKTTTMEAELEPRANQEILLQSNAAYHQFTETVKKVRQQMGLRIRGPQKLDKIAVVEEIVKETVEQKGADLVCIDSFNAIFGDPRRVKLENIRRITGLAAKHGITVVVIHHLNKSKEMNGPEIIRDCFYAIYRLSEEAGTVPLNDNEGIIRLDAEKVKGAKKKSYRMKRTFLDDVTIKYELLSEIDFLGLKVQTGKKENLTSRIENILMDWNDDTIPYNDLLALVGGNPPPTDGAVKGCLKTLLDRKKVQKTNGRWALITIPKR